MKEHVAEIVAAYVGHNTVLPDQLPGLITSVNQALSRLGEAPAAAASPPTPAVPIRRSVGAASIGLPPGHQKLCEPPIRACQGARIGNSRQTANRMKPRKATAGLPRQHYRRRAAGSLRTNHATVQIAIEPSSLPSEQNLEHRALRTEISADCGLSPPV